MSFSLASSGAIIAKSGRFSNSAAQTSGALLQQFSDEAEAFINLYTRYNWVSNAATINAQTSGALQEAVSCLAGIKIIAYDMSGYTTRAEAESIINVLNYQAFRVLDLLKEDVHRKFAIDVRTGAS